MGLDNYYNCLDDGHKNLMTPMILAKLSIFTAKRWQAVMARIKVLMRIKVVLKVVKG